MTVITYCIEYAQSQNSKCQKCSKIIPNKSLRCGRMERENEKQKKKYAKFFWYHFKCFEVPEIWTQVPINLIRGQPDLLDKDKLRLERIIKLGPGGSWQQIVDQHKKKVKDDEDAARAEAEAKGETYVPPTSKNSKKRKAEDNDSEDEDAGDFTTALTGEVDKKTERKNRKINKKLKAKKEQRKDSAAAGGKKQQNKNSKSAAAPAPAKDTVTTKAIAASRADSKALLKKLKKPVNSKA
ncbi:hypothetical protein BGW42_000996 [Actinomortierella wolfii]|nr:hypothetical protein BGW42_000996 [Actinomortierella wolfii]KAG0241238.1 hypothetical protein BGW41_006092 [Actinomortierella wolfii]